MLPLVARNPTIEKVVGEYALAHAEYYETARNDGKNPPINYKDNNALDRFANLVMHEELTWSHPDKMSIVEYPVMSDRNEEAYYGKHTLKGELPFGELRFLGATRSLERSDEGGKKEDVMPSYIPKRRLLPSSDPMIEAVGVSVDLYGALDNAGLTARQREAIERVYFDNMSQTDAAVVMGVTQQAVAKFERTALSKLHAYMTKV